MIKYYYLVCLGLGIHQGYISYVFLKCNDFKCKIVLIVIINCGYYERVNEQVIDGDYPRDGADRCSFCGMSWC
jgi:hypothetical protein